MLVTDLGITGEMSDADNLCYGISFFFLTTDYQFIKKVDLGIGSGDFHLDSWLTTDGSDLLDNIRRTVQVNESLADPHLELVPSLRTFTSRSFPHGTLSLGGPQSLIRSLHLQFLSFLPLISSAHIFFRDSALRLVRVTLRLWLQRGGIGVSRGHGCGVASGPTCSSARANSGEAGAGAGGRGLRYSGVCVFLKQYGISNKENLTTAWDF